MKKLKHLLKDKRHLVFLDFEGTQKSHEMIAFGAVKVDLNDDLTIKKTYKGIYKLVRPKKPIGSFVTELTNITEIDVFDKGISYKKALATIRQYVGKTFKKSKFVFFGNHDVRILHQSFLHSPDADKDTQSILVQESFDYSHFLAEFIKDEKGNPLSLANNLLLFDASFKGQQHNALDDAKNLMHLYQHVLTKKEIVFNKYLHVLSNYKHAPTPIKRLLHELAQGQTVDQSLFLHWIKDYLA
jgi:inhibitor of KinA sporulation pathway (predicted exonuclease)